MVPLDGELLSCLTASQGRRLLDETDRGAYKAGRTIVWRGEVVSRLFIVEKGLVEASYATRMGPAALSLGPGDFFGEISVMEGGPSESRVRAAADDTLVLDLPAGAFRELMAENQELRRRFFEATAMRRTALGAAILGWRAFDPVMAALRPPFRGNLLR